jgi:hypothetical protein
MHESQALTVEGGAAQGIRRPVDGALSLMENASQERRRTIVALVSASIISLVVWGLIVALNVQ